MSNLGDYIKDIRIKKGLTQDELAKNLNVTRQAVSSWERGKSLPDIDMVSKIAKSLNVEVSELLIGQVKSVDVSLNRYKLITYIIILLLTIISSIYIYNKLYPQYKENIEEYAGSCIKGSNINKTLIPIDEHYYHYNITRDVQVDYEFGTYCVPVKFMFTETEGRVDRLKYEVMTSVPYGFNLENDNSYVVYANGNYTLVYSMDVIVVDNKSINVNHVKYPVDGTMQFWYDDRG